MTEARARGVPATRLAQLLLVLAAGGLWAASRLPWVIVRSFDGLGPPKQVEVVGASWSTALVPLGVLALAAAIAPVAVRGWPLRVLAVLMAGASLAAGYLAISMWVTQDAVARGAALADVPVVTLLGGDRHYGGATATLAAALCMLVGAALLMRSASSVESRAATYVPPATRRSMARRAGTGPDNPELSERTLWDALDNGCDPTEGPSGPDAEGR